MNNDGTTQHIRAETVPDPAEYQRGWNDCLAEVHRKLGVQLTRPPAQRYTPPVNAEHARREREAHELARRLGLGGA